MHGPDSLQDRDRIAYHGFDLPQPGQTTQHCGRICQQARNEAPATRRDQSRFAETQLRGDGTVVQTFAPRLVPRRQQLVSVHALNVKLSAWLIDLVEHSAIGEVRLLSLLPASEHLVDGEQGELRELG